MQTLNYFGLFFSFMIPGIVLGAMGGYLLSRRQYRRQMARAAARRRPCAPAVPHRYGQAAARRPRKAVAA